jgi:hypothetical protein
MFSSKKCLLLHWEDWHRFFCFPLSFPCYCTCQGSQDRESKRKIVRFYDLDSSCRADSWPESELGGRGRDRSEKSWERYNRAFQPFQFTFRTAVIPGSDPQSGSLNKILKNMLKTRERLRRSISSPLSINLSVVTLASFFYAFLSSTCFFFPSTFLFFKKISSTCFSFFFFW